MNTRHLMILLAAFVAAMGAVGAYAQDAGEQPAARNDSGPGQVIPPPWGLSGEKNPAGFTGAQFTIPEANIVADFHGNPMTARFVIFSFGHYYGVLSQLVDMFMKENPEVNGLVYFQTIPYGVLEEQMEKRNTITIGNLTLTVQPDVFMGGQSPLEELAEKGYLEDDIVPYMTTTMGIMVPRGNPANIRTLEDLGKPGVRLIMPNPETSGTAQNIVRMLRDAGGEELVEAVYETKVENGETKIITLHHRQTPLALMRGEADAGVTWVTEAIFQEMVGNPITYVTIPEEQNVTGTFSVTMVKNAPHPEISRKWIAFLRSAEARETMRRYGFGVYEGNGE